MGILIIASFCYEVISLSHIKNWKGIWSTGKSLSVSPQMFPSITILVKKYVYYCPLSLILQFSSQVSELRFSSNLNFHNQVFSSVSHVSFTALWSCHGQRKHLQCCLAVFDWDCYTLGKKCYIIQACEQIFIIKINNVFICGDFCPFS